MKHIFLIIFVGALIYAPHKVEEPKEHEIIIIGHFKHDKRLQDAGDFDKPKLDTAIQRKVNALKLESDKWKK